MKNPLDDAVFTPYTLDPNPYSQENIANLNALLCYLAMDPGAGDVTAGYKPLMDLVMIGYRTVKDKKGEVTPRSVAETASWFGVSSPGGMSYLIIKKDGELMRADWSEGKAPKLNLEPNPAAERQAEADEFAKAQDAEAGFVAVKDIPPEVAAALPADALQEDGRGVPVAVVEAAALPAPASEPVVPEAVVLAENPDALSDGPAVDGPETPTDSPTAVEPKAKKGK